MDSFGGIFPSGGLFSPPDGLIWGTFFIWGTFSSGGLFHLGDFFHLWDEAQNFTLTFKWLVCANSTRRDTLHEVFLRVPFLLCYIIVEAVGVLAWLVSIA